MRLPVKDVLILDTLGVPRSQSWERKPPLEEYLTMLTRQSPIKHLVPLALFFLLGLLCAVLYLNHLASLATIRNGPMPGMAAFDRQVFQEYSHPEDLRATGKIFPVPEGTRCQVIKRDMTSSCQGNGYPFQIKLLDGPRKGAVVWMCSSNVAMTMAWP